MTSVKAPSGDLGSLILDLYLHPDRRYLHAVIRGDPDRSVVYIPTSAMIHVHELRRRTFCWLSCRNNTRHVMVVRQREWLMSDLPSF